MTTAGRGLLEATAETMCHNLSNGPKAARLTCGSCKSWCKGSRGTQLLCLLNGGSAGEVGLLDVFPMLKDTSQDLAHG